jgi:hypothetical protein
MLSVMNEGLTRERQPRSPGRGSGRLKLIFTLDYEIHGNGEGSPLDLMVCPTDRLLDLLEGFGAKLTIMADTVEILKFREYRDSSGRDDWAYGAIERQLKDTVARGHDVQLHQHPAYARAHAKSGKWILDWSEYDLARLGYERISALVREGRDYLEGLLGPVRPGYRCQAFRSANWSMCPSTDAVRVLSESGFKIDTSVFKYGFRDELVHFNYSGAESETVPWPVDASDVCRRDDRGELFEFPIYSESRLIWSFISVNRFNRVIQGLIHPLPGPASPRTEAEVSVAPVAGAGRVKSALRTGVGLLSDLFHKHAWKLDFNQCSGSQMVSALRRARARHADRIMDLPIVLIGHSKLFNAFNAGQLRTFLRYVASRPDDFGFGTFGDFDLERFRRPAQP